LGTELTQILAALEQGDDDFSQRNAVLLSIGGRSRDVEAKFFELHGSIRYKYVGGHEISFPLFRWRAQFSPKWRKIRPHKFCFDGGGVSPIRESFPDCLRRNTDSTNFLERLLWFEIDVLLESEVVWGSVAKTCLHMQAVQ
jgi:hypothetical protein